MELRLIGKRKRDLKYDQSLNNPLYLQMNVTVKAVKEFFDQTAKDGLIIYDFGCGVKPYQDFAGTNKYIGIDIDKKNELADIFSNIENVPVRDGVADIVCSFHVLEHVYSPKNVLREKSRVLKSKGLLFMLVPFYWEEHEQPYDFWRFTQFSLRNMLKEAGFVNVEIKPLNATWSILGINIVRGFSYRRFARFMVPILNWIFFTLDQKKLRKKIVQSNVMTYEVRALKK